MGACLFIALVGQPGASAYMLSDLFVCLIAISVAIGTVSSFVVAYLRYFIDGATGGVIVTLQTLLFLTAFYFAPKHGVIAARRKARAVQDENLREGNAIRERPTIQESA